MQGSPGHDSIGDLHHLRAGRHRTVQPGDRRRRLRLPRRARGRSTRRSGEFLHGTIEEETHRTLRNVGAILDAAGVSYADVVKTTVFLADLGDFAAMNAIYATYFPDPPPARSTVEVAALPKGFKVEIEVVAYRQRVG